MPTETLEAARGAILMAYGVLPALLNPATTGPLVREAQRHLALAAMFPCPSPGGFARLWRRHRSTTL